MGSWAITAAGEAVGAGEEARAEDYGSIRGIVGYRWFMRGIAVGELGCCGGITWIGALQDWQLRDCRVGVWDSDCDVFSRDYGLEDLLDCGDAGIAFEECAVAVA